MRPSTINCTRNFISEPPLHSFVQDHPASRSVLPLMSSNLCVTRFTKSTQVSSFSLGCLTPSTTKVERSLFSMFWVMVHEDAPQSIRAVRSASKSRASATTGYRLPHHKSVFNFEKAAHPANTFVGNSESKEFSVLPKSSYPALSHKDTTSWNMDHLVE